MTVERYVRIITGIFILVSVALAISVSGWWLILTVLIGANLIQSSFTGRCLVEKILEKFGIRDPNKINCALFVAKKLREQFPLDKETMARLSACAGGKAPEECCGAFYAAKRIQERYSPHNVEKNMEQFRSFAGSLKCREIKALKKKSCRECVEKAIEVVRDRPKP